MHLEKLIPRQNPTIITIKIIHLGILKKFSETKSSILGLINAAVIRKIIPLVTPVEEKLVSAKSKSKIEKIKTQRYIKA